MNFDVVIVGGGAAGLFCAIEAGKRGRRVLVLERNAQLGRKIIISGGGRCNFTNLHTSAENFISQNPHFCKSALARYTPADFVQLVRRHRIEFYEKKLGQLFCRDSSKQILGMLVSEADRNKVRIRTGCAVARVERKNDSFQLTTSIGKFGCESLVIATGGLSFPKIGATEFGYSIARQFGLKIEATRPSLVALVFDRTNASPSKLAGVTVDASVTVQNQIFRENVLFTHRGMSGPAILQASNYWRPDSEMTIDLAPGSDLENLFESNGVGQQSLSRLLNTVLPARLVASLVSEELLRKPIKQLRGDELAQTIEKLNRWRVRFRDTEGYDKAEVTLGGISTSELSSQTMEARTVSGLYFIGEVVDVTGWLGGYNFQWAWASGHAAGQQV